MLRGSGVEWDEALRIGFADGDAQREGIDSGGFHGTEWQRSHFPDSNACIAQQQQGHGRKGARFDKGLLHGLVNFGWPYLAGAEKILAAPDELATTKPVLIYPPAVE